MHITLTQAQQTLKPWFKETDRGLELTDPQTKPPLKAYEVQALKLRGEEAGWQIKVGDLAANLRRHYPQAYQQVFEMCGLAGYHRSMTTIEGWASACRSVPHNVRNGLSISYLQVVAPVTDPLDQRDLLNDAKERGMSVASFRTHVATFRGITETPETPPWEERDGKLFETEREAYELEVRLQDALKQAQEATGRAERAEMVLDTLRGRIEALVEMKPTDLMVNIHLVVRTLRDVLAALAQLSSHS